MSLLLAKVTSEHFPDFCAPKSLFGGKVIFSGKVTFELPGLGKVPISYWFLKGWEPSARTTISDGEKWISRRILRKS